MAIRLIDGKSEDERQRVIGALTLAFVKDPMARWMYPEPGEYLRHFPGFAAVFGGPSFANGTAWADESWGGASLWFPSGVGHDGDAVEAHFFGTIAEAKHETVGRIFEKMDEFHPEEPHWYLSIVGVDAAHQGKGLGATLLQDALRHCDEEGLIAYLESSNPANISLYERHGFQVAGEIQIDDAPLLTPMLRPAV